MIFKGTVLLLVISLLSVDGALTTPREEEDDASSTNVQFENATEIVNLTEQHLAKASLQTNEDKDVTTREELEKSSESLQPVRLGCLDWWGGGGGGYYADPDPPSPPPPPPTDAPFVPLVPPPFPICNCNCNWGNGNPCAADIGPCCADISPCSCNNCCNNGRNPSFPTCEAYG